MTVSSIDLVQSLNKAYRLLKPRRNHLDIFKNNLNQLLNHIDEKESEENVKIHLMDFLKQTFFNPDYLVATKGKTDFVIHLGKDSKSSAGVLFEVKKPTNKSDMVSKSNLNTKAMHELILYFLRERLENKNNSLTQLVITNIYEWYVFDAALFERVFVENSNLQKSYFEWQGGQKVSTKTELFYLEIAKPFLQELDKEINFTYFDIRDYKKELKGHSSKDDNVLVPLYKFFTPAHLLKLPFINDSNSLDKGFYAELLHIIGLKEFKENGKRVIIRLPVEDRNAGSIIENTINILELENSIRKVQTSQLSGITKDEQIFNLALELCITWINRILFLKLLEAQLLIYHSSNSKYKFLNIHTIRDFDELYKLFFQVLAKPNSERTQLVQAKYSHIPYLNSSLFEISELEDVSLKINGLDDNIELSLYITSILKRNIDRKNITSLNTLHYLFEFLDAYDFSSIGKEEIQEENKPIINAAVLGLVFEKINGYKDGSYYTPGTITMFLCRETIRRAVVKKFNDSYNWTCETVQDVRNYIADKRNSNDILKFNQTIESVRLIDPAVGSGHFLVSSLNELILIKSELGILADTRGNRLSDIEISIVNDELIITDGRTQKFFEYNVKESGNGGYIISTDTQTIQETLFNEKRKIIEGCLFGVDINSNSVKICQLRLWIELLKHAYYKLDNNFSELETLPNIDINIKCGNSLLSKFSLKEDLSDVFKKQKFGVKEYQSAVTAYKESPDKESKKLLLDFLKTIKDQFKQTVAQRDPKRKRLSELRGQLSKTQNNYDLFGKKKSDQEVLTEVEKLNKNINKLEEEIANIQNNAIYKHAFEWRFEFPEVMNDKGDFDGFEAIIGNPPYIQLQKMGESADILEKLGYQTFARTGDVYCLFYELAVNLLKPDYYFGFITSNKWMRANYGEPTRKFFIEKTNPILLIDFGGYQVFDSATVDTNLIISQKSPYKGKTKTCLIDKSLGSLEKMSDFIRQSKSSQTTFKEDSGWVILSAIENRIKGKIEYAGIPLKDWDINIYRGILTGLNEAFIIDKHVKDKLIEASPKNAEIIRPILRGKDIHRFYHDNADQWVIYIPWHFPLHENESIKGSSLLAEEMFLKEYPAVYDHLTKYKDALENRNKAETGIRYEWYALQRFGSNYWKDFAKKKIVWGNLALRGSYSLVDEGVYVNAPSAFIPTSNLYLLGVLNSKLADFYIKRLGVTRNGGYFEYKPMFVEQLPIPKSSQDIQDEISSVVSEILGTKEFDSIELNEKLDQIIFELYGLNPEEKLALLEFANRSISESQ